MDLPLCFSKLDLQTGTSSVLFFFNSEIICKPDQQSKVIVLGLAEMELSFCITACMVQCFGFVT